MKFTNSLPRVLLPISLVFFTCIGSSHQQSASDLPACSQTCIGNAIIAAGCKQGDRSCECSNSITISNGAALCLVEACSSADITKAQTVSTEICAAYYSSAANGFASSTAGTPTGTSATDASKTPSPTDDASTTKGAETSESSAATTSPLDTTATGSATSKSSGKSTTAPLTLVPTSGSSSSSSSSGSSGIIPSTSSRRKRKGLATGAKAGIAVAAVAVVAIIAIFLFFFIRRKRRSHPEVAVHDNLPYQPATNVHEVEGRPGGYYAVPNGSGMKDNAHTTTSPVGTEVSMAQTYASPVSPVAYHHELPNDNSARIVNVAEADSYAVPHMHEVDSNTIPSNQMGYSYPQQQQNQYYNQVQEADSSNVQELSTHHDITYPAR